MSGRIYDTGINPKCDKCGSDMYTSKETNFNGCRCKRKGCEGMPIYQPFEDVDTSNKSIEIIDGKIFLTGAFTRF